MFHDFCLVSEFLSLRWPFSEPTEDARFLLALTHELESGQFSALAAWIPHLQIKETGKKGKGTIWRRRRRRGRAAAASRHPRECGFYWPSIHCASAH